MHERRTGKRLILAVEITFKRQVNGGLLSTIKINLHMPIFSIRRPDTPDNAGPFHLCKDEFAILFADDAIAVPISHPVNIFASCVVVLTLAVIT